MIFAYRNGIAVRALNEYWDANVEKSLKHLECPFFFHYSFERRNCIEIDKLDEENKNHMLCN